MGRFACGIFFALAGSLFTGQAVWRYSSFQYSWDSEERLCEGQVPWKPEHSILQYTNHQFTASLVLTAGFCTACLGFFLSCLDTTQRDSYIDENLITGGRRRERRVSSITQHKLRRCSQSGQLISWEKQVTVLSESDEPEDSIKQLALNKRRLSLRRNSELVSLIKI